MKGIPISNFGITPAGILEPIDVISIYKVTKIIPENHTILKSSISNHNTSYFTKAFIIQYMDEEVDLNEAVVFRVEVDPDLVRMLLNALNCKVILEPLLIQFDLMFVKHNSR